MICMGAAAAGAGRRRPPMVGWKAIVGGRGRMVLLRRRSWCYLVAHKKENEMWTSTIE